MIFSSMIASLLLERSPNEFIIAISKDVHNSYHIAHIFSHFRFANLMSSNALSQEKNLCIFMQFLTQQIDNMQFIINLYISLKDCYYHHL